MEAVLCECGLNAIMRQTKKDGPNKDRWFYCCGSTDEHKCGFFRWEKKAATYEKKRELSFETPGLPQPDPIAMSPPPVQKARRVVRQAPDRIRLMRESLLEQAKMCIEAAMALEPVAGQDSSLF